MGCWDSGLTEIKTVLVYRRDLISYSETFILRQVLALRDWQPVLVGQIDSDGLPLDSIEYHHLKLRMTMRNVRRFSRVRRYLRSLSFGTIAAARSSNSLLESPNLQPLRERRPKLLHVHFGTDALDARHLAEALNLPMIITLHGYDITTRAEWWESGAGGTRYCDYPQTLLALAEQGTIFVVVSDAIAESALEFGIPERSLRKIIIGTDLAAFTPGSIPMESRPARVLFVGRFVEKKGIDFLLKAFQLVQRKVPEAQLRLVGDGDLEEALCRKAKDLQLNARFVGRLTPTQVADEMHEARVLCSPSIRAANGNSEGLPTVIMEAQACGLPVVTSARGGVTEGIIDKVTGRAFAEGDVNAMADHLVHYLTHVADAEKAAAAARKFSEGNFDIGRNTKVLEALYDEVARAGRRSD